MIFFILMCVSLVVLNVISLLDVIRTKKFYKKLKNISGLTPDEIRKILVEDDCKCYVDLDI